MYEMIILFHPYGTLVAYIMQHGGKAHNLSGNDGTYIMIAHARVAYTIPCDVNTGMDVLILCPGH